MNSQLKQLLREFENAAWKCGTDEYRDDVSDRAVQRRANELATARQNLEDAIDAALAQVEVQP